MADDPLRLTIDGTTYTIDPDDLELGEVELLEDTMGAALEDIDFNRAKAMRVLVYIAVHRVNPDFTMEDAAKVKIGSITEPEDESAAKATKRPTKAAKSG